MNIDNFKKWAADIPKVDFELIKYGCLVQFYIEEKKDSKIILKGSTAASQDKYFNIGKIIHMSKEVEAMEKVEVGDLISMPLADFAPNVQIKHAEGNNPDKPLRVAGSGNPLSRMAMRLVYLPLSDREKEILDDPKASGYTKNAYIITPGEFEKKFTMEQVIAEQESKLVTHAEA